jgi:hypothetical protein
MATLITTIAEFKKYIAIDGNMKWATIEPYVKEAEQLYMKDLLGPEFYDEFLPLYTASVTGEAPVALSAQNAALLPYIQRCLAYYAQLQAITHIAVTFGEMGIRQHSDQDSSPAARWQQDQLKFQALRNGDIHADLLLAFLEENEDDYATWKESDANPLNSGCIVYSTAIASKHIDINNSRRIFLKLRNKIREIERKSVPRLIGQEQYDELLEQLQDMDPDALTEANAILVGKLEPIIAKRALYMQLPSMRVQINENGIFIYSGTDDLYKLGQLAAESDIKILRTQLMDEKEFGYLADENELKQFILDNIDDYPLIKASTAYTVQPDPGPTWQPLNDPNNNHFAV